MTEATLPTAATGKLVVFGRTIDRGQLASLLLLAFGGGIVLGAKLTRGALEASPGALGGPGAAPAKRPCGCEDSAEYDREIGRAYLAGAAAKLTFAGDRHTDGLPVTFPPQGPEGDQRASANAEASGPSTVEKIEPVGGGVVESPEGGTFPFIPPGVEEEPGVRVE